MYEYIDAKTIVGRGAGSSWFGVDYNMNIYRGCPHGCIYCDSRSECYGIDDFSRVGVKRDALRIIRDDLRRKQKTGVVGTGAMGDPYNPCEKELELTRHALELISYYGFGAAIATKSPLITRDIDILNEIREVSPVICKITITTADDGMSKKIEPNVAPSSERFEAIRALSQGSIYAGILLMPVLPFITDSDENILGIVEQAAKSGAKFIYAAFGMTLRDRQRAYYYGKLDSLFPGLSQTYMRNYAGRYGCKSPRSKELWALFTEACNANGIAFTMPQIIRGYKRGYGDSQLSMFDSK